MSVTVAYSFNIFSIHCHGGNIACYLLTFTTLWANSEDHKLIFLFFSQKKWDLTFQFV